MKKTLICLLLCVSPVLAQNGSSKPPTIATDELLKIHALVQTQNQQALLMKEAQLTLERTRSAIIDLEEQIKAWVSEHAKKRNVDLATHQFDFIRLDFVPIKKVSP